MQINSILFYFICIICRSIANPTLTHMNNVADLQRCKHIHNNRWHRRTFLQNSTAAKNIFALEFYVIGSGNCSIDLSATNSTNTIQSAYHLVIGGWYNTRISVRRDLTLLRSMEFQKVLSVNEPVRINIEISHFGEIKIFRHGEFLMKTIDRNSTIDIHYFRFGTHESSERMRFYDCFNDNAEIISQNPIEIHYTPTNIAVIISSANKLRTFSPIMVSFVALYLFVVLNC